MSQSLQKLCDASGSSRTKRSVQLSVLFTNDREMTRLNSEYRNKHKTTDVLSFPLGEKEEGYVVLGDIVISLPQALRQAREHRSTPRDELTRLLIHGYLHLLGYDHEISESEARRMERKEREIFRALTVPAERKPSSRRAKRAGSNSRAGANRARPARAASPRGR